MVHAISTRNWYMYFAQLLIHLQLTSLTHPPPVLEAPPTFYAGSDEMGAFARFVMEFLHVFSVGLIKKTFELTLDYIEEMGHVTRLNALNRRAVKLNMYIWGLPNHGPVKFKLRPRGITKKSRLPGEEYWCLIWMLLFSIGTSNKIITSDSKRNKILKALVACL